jgi:hypothetical protein
MKKWTRKMKTVTTRKLRLLSTPRILLIAFMAVFPAGLGSSPLRATPPQQVKPGQPYAVIFGTVWGPDNHPVYGVTVRIRRATDKPKKTRWEVYSDHHGEFAQRVPAGEGDYILSANMKGVKGPDGRPLHLVEEVKVHIYNDERQDTGLHLSY